MGRCEDHRLFDKGTTRPIDKRVRPGSVCGWRDNCSWDESSYSRAAGRVLSATRVAERPPRIRLTRVSSILTVSTTSSARLSDLEFHT
jgi:hypothetical protein